MKPYFRYAARIIPLLAAGTFAVYDSGRAGESPDSQTDAGVGKVSFNQHVQPILSEYCYHCHGPDSGTREPKKEPLRLDRGEDAFLPREGGVPVILKGRPGESELVRRLHDKNPDSIMPPPESHKAMKPEDIAVIERWIEQGAEYESHWSFSPVRRPDVPAVGNNRSANPIDHFVAEKLRKSGLTPNPPEDAGRFYRRLHLDLTGLPPSPGQIDAFRKSFAGDPGSAVGAAADELLSTTACAENSTRHWLDAARYADTHGIHIDNYRSIWPYRDWVIRAFQANMPWDRFTTEQIAGDMLPNRTLDQLVATGFSRCVATTGEGGAIPEEYDAVYAKDRVETVSAIWLGLTTGCAACHDHKFDPVSTKEFYSLTSFFRNTPMSALDGNKEDHPPNVIVPAMEDRARWETLAIDISETGKQLAARAESAAPEFQSWLKSFPPVTPGEPDPMLSLHLPLDESEGPLRGLVDGKPREWPVAIARTEALFGKAPVVSESPVELGDFGNFSRGDRVTYGGFLRIRGTPTGAVVARMNPSESFRGWDLYLEGGKPAAHVIDSWDKSANKIVAPEKIRPGEWHHVMITFDGTLSGTQASAIYVDGKDVGGKTSPGTIGGNIETKVPLRLGSREGGDSKLSDQVALQDFRFYRRLLTPAEIRELAENSRFQRVASLPEDKRTKEQMEVAMKYFLTHIDAPTRELRARLEGLKSEQGILRQRASVSLVMEEKKDEPFAHVLTRGGYADKGEKVTPATPAVLPPMAADAPKNRLGLARWLNDPANPLPARVTMNRTWYYFFGTGIVETNSDFGIMGARPSHPELLDWLAAEFIDSGWDYRHMLKLIVTSATYRQSANVSPEKLEKDPANRLLARGPRHRLDAEVIRDLALSSASLLANRVGGPSVKPYQPEGIWEAVAMKESNTRNYRQDTGEALYRRSLYTLWKRTAAPPSMEIFNAPTRETFCVQRDLTNTPLQALVLLNDPQFVEASRELASHALAAADEFNTRLDHITTRLTGRTFDAAEREILEKSLAAALSTYRENPQDASKLITTGATPPRPDADVPELAAWTLLTSQILNLDETITR
ncbi:DUF1553 domain-containing protein [Luteolibacter yonseiensis]|uniref:DUF1553 domain-containing protein n=1 Tax=Luteolibacter yonseiensis TaxID=1144680 RepID=A0A934R7B4_9BACT|nr:DUF1553 domain-containing protein [Luteolibacter yonseiensis]MBK1817667.1 DUF1553 domain-containing protein [Luteolibacter yonseiensis]